MEYFWFVIFRRRDVFVFLVFGINFDNEYMFCFNNDIVFFIFVVDMDLLVCDYKCSLK